jgi:type I restriction enzyme S subunit
MRSVGVSYPAINASDLGDISIHLPPGQHQRDIADYLDRETAQLDTLVAAKERLLAQWNKGASSMPRPSITKLLGRKQTLTTSSNMWILGMSIPRAASMKS